MPNYKVTIVPCDRLLRAGTSVALLPVDFAADPTDFPFMFLGKSVDLLFPQQTTLCLFSNDVIPDNTTYHLLLPRAGAYEYSRKQDRSLPIIEGMSPYVYESTKVPNSIKEAEEEIIALKAEVVSLNESIERITLNHRASLLDELEDEENDAPWKHKRQAMLNARLTKRNQMLLLHTWIEQVKPQRHSDPRVIVTKEAREQYRSTLERLENEIKNLRLAAKVDPRDYANHRREVTFLRRTLGEISGVILHLLEADQHALKPHLLEQLQLNHERLLKLDQKIAALSPEAE